MLSGVLALGWVLGPIWVPMLWLRRLRGKEEAGRWREKLGRIPLPRPEGPVIWVHAVSVGESLSVLPLLQALTARADLHVLLTCTTVTAMDLMRGRVPERVILQYLPVDLPGPVARFLSHWRPDVAVMVESEFWPRLIHATHSRGIPLILANARISDRSAGRWARMRGLAGAILGRFNALVATDAAMAARLVALGADPARVRVTGTLKRGAARLPVDAAELARLRAALAGRQVWLAGSTHPGEEAAVLEAHRALSARLPEAILILAPRHPVRGDEVAGLVTAAGLTQSRRSRGEAPAGQVYLADTLGEMGLWFDLCPVSFIGGSLVAGIGGHNAYEPALHGSAILHGPHVGNFADLYARLDGAGAARVVADAATLARAVAALEGDPAARAALTDAARAVLAAEADGVSETVSMILGLLPEIGAATRSC
ncbi:MAG: 3-deoxy-D-manno-octulosonic acid transferase [Paracoccaceae bacterium]